MTSRTRLGWLPGLLFVLAGTAPAQLGQSGLGHHVPADRALLLDAVSPGPVEPVPSGRLPPVLWLVDGVAVPSGQLQPAPSVSAQLVLVLDALNSTAEQFAQSVDSVAAFLASADGRLAQRTTILILAGPSGAASPAATPGKRQAASLDWIPASTDGAQLRALLLKAVAKRGAMAAGTVADRVGLSLNALLTLADVESGQPGAKVVLWIGPGWPLLPGRVQQTAAAREQIFNSVMSLSDGLLRARMLLYAISPAGISSGGRGGFDEGFLLATRQGNIAASGHSPAVPDYPSDLDYLNFIRQPGTAAQSSPNHLALQVLAVDSGGLVIQHGNALAAALARSAADAGRIQSVLYLPETPATPGLHTLTARTTGPGGVPLRTRRGFYGR